MGTFNREILVEAMKEFDNQINNSDKANYYSNLIDEQIKRNENGVNEE